jgi:hypothetical protein
MWLGTGALGHAAGTYRRDLVAAELLTLRQLNRATLHRQLLLERVRRPAVDVIRDFAGLQGQNPRDPYIALWSRLERFQPEELETLILERTVVRIGVQRGTVHAVTADDCLVLRPLAQPIMAQQLRAHPDFKGAARPIDVEAVTEHARRVLSEQPRTARQLRAALAERFPEFDPAAMLIASRFNLAYVQVPPRGLWNRGGQVVGTTAEAWLERSLVPDPKPDPIILRYLAAFGPATVQDAATWSRYTGLREVFDRLRPRLRTFRDEVGRELFDVAESTIPDADVPAPVRFLPEYDNVLLGHADRRRFVTEDFRARMPYEQLGFLGNILVDGALAGGWRADGATLRVYTVDTISNMVRDAVEDEGRRLLALLRPGSEHDVAFEVVGKHPAAPTPRR